MTITRWFGRSPLFITLILAAPEPAFAAEPSTTEDVVPVEHASFHQPVFADEDVAILDNLYPPQGDSGFHTHYRDLFAVIIQSSPTRSETPGQPPKDASLFPVGSTTYSPVGDEPRTHRVINIGETAFQAIVIELRRAKPEGTAVGKRDEAPQYEQILDNSRMRAWRLILEPGASAPAIVQRNKGVRVVVRGGLLTTVRSGVHDQTLSVRAGDVAVQPGGETRGLKNSGEGTIELVEIELK